MRVRFPTELVKDGVVPPLAEVPGRLSDPVELARALGDVLRATPKAPPRQDLTDQPSFIEGKSEKFLTLP